MYINKSKQSIGTPKEHILIVKQCLAGNKGSEFQLYELYSKALFNTCLRMLNSESDAEDILQETFVKIFKNLKSYNTASNFYTWANRIAINSCINHQNKKSIDYTLDYGHEIEMRPAEDSYSEEEVQLTVESVNRGIRQLPNGYREILSLYLLEGYDHREISEILDISESTSKSQYARAKKKLRTLIQRNHG
ncbi:MAG: RNA polymerase sigma factor [Bacteroidia bacterium]